MQDHVLQGFFSDDPEAALRAVAALADPGAGVSHGAVRSAETLYAVRGEERLRAAKRGILSEVIFGPALDDRCACGATAGAASRGVTCPRCGVLCDRASLRDERWGHVDVVQVLHPIVYRALFVTLGISTRDGRDVAHGKKALRPSKGGAGEPSWSVVPEDSMEDNDLIGPSGLAEALRTADPAHPHLPLCALTKVPIPPPGLRPPAPKDAPSQVDPWIGPLNEAWLDLVERAGRHVRLVELGAPAVILNNESALTQRAFEVVFDRTEEATAWLAPPLERVPDDLRDDQARAMAFADADRLVLQQRHRVLLLDLRDGSLVSLPPAGNSLRGVANGRFAVFEGFFTATHPQIASDPGFGPDFVRDDPEGGRQFVHYSEISIVDCATGTYLKRRPPGLRLTFATNDEPEDLFLTTPDGTPLRRLRVGGDRPEALAYACGLEIAWVGEEENGTEIIDLSRGIPHAYPAEPGGTDVPRWDLRTGKIGGDDGDGSDDDDDDDDGDDDVYAGRAVAYRDGAWHLLWSSSILCDHRARDAVRLHPAPHAAAFDPTGRVLALLVGDAVIVVDVVRREVLRRVALPDAPGGTP